MTEERRIGDCVLRAMSGNGLDIASVSTTVAYCFDDSSNVIGLSCFSAAQKGLLAYFHFCSRVMGGLAISIP
jgi:hypothetical protein